MELYAGIDVGGTKILSIIADEKGKIYGQNKLKTKSGNNIFETIKSSYLNAINEAGIEEKEIKSIGLAMPSSINQDTKKLLNAPNLGLKDLEIYNIALELFNKPIFIDNDVNMGLYGEYIYGDLHNYRSVYGIFLGTGVGGGFIYNGEIVRGHGFTAGEVGHMIIDIHGRKCNCGNKGCLETIAGKIGIVNYIKRQKNKPIILEKIAPDWKESVGYKDLYKAYHKKDRPVIKAVGAMSKAVGITCANLINTIGVDAVVIGGGAIDEFGDEIMNEIKRIALKNSIGGGGDTVLITNAKLKEHSVALGCIAFTSNPLHESILSRAIL